MCVTSDLTAKAVTSERCGRASGAGFVRATCGAPARSPSLLAGSAASIAIGALLVAGSDGLVRLAMWSRSAGGEAVVETGRGFFRFCAATQLLSGLVIVMASILRGLRDANAVLWLVMLGYWGVGLGGAVLFAFAFGLGGTGIWIGITLAFVFAVVLLGLRFSSAFARLDRGPA
jgi:Na+-driven multidrug efflux pump